MTENTRSQIYSVKEDNPEEQANRPVFVEGVALNPDGSIETTHVQNSGNLENKSYIEYFKQIADSGTSLTLDVSQANVFDVTLTADCSIDLTGATTGDCYSVTIRLNQDSTGGRAVTWPASVQWDSGSAPSLTTAAGTLSIVSFQSVDGGETWQGFLGGDDFA